MKKYLFGVAVIILCLACAICIHKGRASEVSKERILPKVGQTQRPAQTKPTQQPLYTANSIVVSNGVIVADMREKVPPGSPDYESYLLERKKIAEHGIDAKVTLHVVDQDGKDVPNADINMHFSCNNRRNEPILGKTDNMGCFTATDKLTGEIIYSVTKEGYYRTRSKFWLMQRDIRSFENGRWIPWNPTLQVTLKEIGKPVPMYVKKAKIKIPKKNQPFGFDLEVGDLVEPQGKGKHSDIVLMSYGDKPFPLTLNYSETLEIQSNNSLGGFLRKKKDEWSALLSDNEAPEDGYVSAIKLFTTSKEGEPILEDNVKQEDGIIFRTRGMADEKGNLKSAHYGKIYGPLKHGINSNDRDGAGVTITYYFNPTPNDRNLEFDGKNNLFKETESLEEVYTP